MPLSPVAAQQNGSSGAETGARLRDFHCHGCGRRLFTYAELGSGATINARCRDCKTLNTLRGADVVALLGALSHGGGGAER